MGRLDTLGYDELLAEAEPYLRRYASDGGGPAPAAPTAGPSQGPKGGQFALGGGRVGGKPKGRPARRPQGHGQPGSQHPATFGWDGRHGTGYGQKDGDPHVHDLQEAINLLGITDSHGQALKDDGKFGPRTDSAVKKLQKRLGMEQTGQVTQEFIDQVVRIAARVSRGRKPRRKPAAHRSADDEERDPAHYGEGDVADADPAGYGRVVLAGDPWLRERAGGILRDGLPELPLGDDDMVAALLVALAELTGDDLGLRAFNPAQKRIPKGQPGAGRFMSMVDRVKGAIEEHLKGKGDGHPLDEFSREQLRKVAKARGIELKRGESRDSIAEKLLAHLKGKGDGSKPKGSTKAEPKAGAEIKDITRRDLEKATARRALANAEADLAKARTESARDSARERIDAAKVRIEERPDSGYNWDSPYWDEPSGRSVRGTPDAEQIDAELQRIFKGTNHPGNVRVQAEDELRRQAQIAPLSLFDLRRVNDASSFHRDDASSTALAYYSPGTAQITLGPDASSGNDAADRIELDRIHSIGWWVRTDGTHVGSITSHEFGHHIAHRTRHATRDTRRHMAEVFDRELGAGGAIRDAESGLEGAITEWLDRSEENRVRMGKLISRYGKTNGHELIAEVWAEFSANGSPRPHIRAMGLALQRAAEEFEVVSTR